MTINAEIMDTTYNIQMIQPLWIRRIMIYGASPSRYIWIPTITSNFWYRLECKILAIVTDPGRIAHALSRTAHAIEAAILSRATWPLW